MARKYLNDVGVKSDETCVPLTTDRDGDSERLNRFMEEREQYGFDSRETWSLEYTAAMWLYEHLMMYKDYAGKIVDLGHHRFMVSKVEVPQEIWETKDLSRIDSLVTISPHVEMTQLEAINLCCEYLKDYIQTEERQETATTLHKDSPHAGLIQETIDIQKARQAFHIFAELFPAMWW